MFLLQVYHKDAQVFKRLSTISKEHQNYLDTRHWCFEISSGWYDRRSIGDFRTIIDLNFVAAMGPPGGGRNPVTARLLRHFHYLAFPDIQDDSKVKFSWLLRYIGTFTKGIVLFVMVMTWLYLTHSYCRHWKTGRSRIHSIWAIQQKITSFSLIIRFKVLCSFHQPLYSNLTQWILTEKYFWSHTKFLANAD